jgi:hypothetical protein
LIWTGASRAMGLAALAALLAACPAKSVHRRATEPSPSDRFPVTTDARVYHLKEFPNRFDAYAVATYKNRTGKTVHFARCKSDDRTPMYELRRVGDVGMHTTVGAIWACVGGVPSGAIPAGGSASVRVWLGSAKSPHAQPPDNDQDRIGTFRILFALCQTRVNDSDHCVAVPEAERRSDAFDIRFS